MTDRFSYYSQLTCSQCARTFDHTQPQTFCPECKAPLLAGYDLAALRSDVHREEISRRARGMWRWHELLPIFDPAHIASLGEGDAPLLPAPRLGAGLGMAQLLIKDESLNPTGTFKARGLSAAVSKAKELGIEKVIIPTAGNAGGAMAAYAARAGMRAHIYMPKDTPYANVRESQAVGAVVEFVDGLISDAAVQANARASAEGWFDLSTFKEPFRLEGKKVMGLELAEQLGWTLPDVILYPTGGGTGLVGMWKAFAELEALGWLEEARRPRMVVVQADGCAPVVKAYQEGKEACEFWAGAHTLASGLRVPKSFADRLILHILRETRGCAVAVSDEAITQAQARLGAAEGIFAAPEGAATLAALELLLAQGWITPNERVVLFNTGTGLKYLQ